MPREIKKSVTIKGESFVILRMPLILASNTFDLILKTYGQSIVNIVSSLIFENKDEKEGKKEADLNTDQFEKAFTSYIKNAKHGQTLIVLEALINPEYVKHGNNQANMRELYNQFGLKFLFKLSFEIIKFNYDDFLSFS